MGLTSAKKAQRAKAQYLAEDIGDRELADAWFRQVQDFFTLERVSENIEIEELLLKQKEHEIELLKKGKSYPNLPRFSPSAMNKCDTALFRVANKIKLPPQKLYPYNRRWTRAGSAVHEYSQRDMLYMEKVLQNPRFTVKRNEIGLPFWEKNVATYREFNHNGQTFLISGMLDGMLVDNITGQDVLFEKKTKSTTKQQTGTYLMKGPQEGHIKQGTAYACLFMDNPYADEDLTEIFEYENLSRDNWNKGADAVPDLRTFQHKITLEDRMELLDRLAYICGLDSEPPHVGCEDFFCSISQSEVKM